MVLFLEVRWVCNIWIFFIGSELPTKSMLSAGFTDRVIKRGIRRFLLPITFLKKKIIYIGTNNVSIEVVGTNIS